MHPLLEKLPRVERERLGKGPLPAWMDPMLATLTDRRISDEGWLFERKLDGERCLVFKDGDTVLLLSRTRQRLNDTYPELEGALQNIAPCQCILDGEIVAFEGRRTRFSRLQQRLQIRSRREARKSSVAVFLYLFDLLYLDGYDLTGVSLRHRKSVLKRLIEFRAPLRYTIHRNGNGGAFFREACEKGWEGIIAKRAGGRYVHRRSTDWLKFKCIRQQEFVIGGYTEPGGSRIGFGALLLGYYEGDDLVYAGKVGTGFDDEMLRDLGEQLALRERKTSPFAKKTLDKGEHGVSPDLVGEVAFTEWTEDGKLRHPRFLGLRRDKPAKEVVRERPE
jgi:bifunctional non-homologous end joining protein LigD